MILRCLFVCLFFSVRLAYGNDNYLVEYIGIERGLSNNAVTCIYQDHHGFMWFGTYDGLNRYDGYSFKVFRNVIGESNSLRDNHIYAIEEDASYNLWVGGIKGISIYNPVTSRFSIPHIFSWNKKGLQVLTEGVGVIRSVNKGEYLLAGTQDRGLIVFDKNSTVGTQVPLYDRKGQEGNYGVAAIEIDPSGKYAWVFVHDAGLYRYDIKAKTLTAVSRVVPYSYCLEMNGKENIWVGNNNGLYKYNISTASYSAAIPFKHRIVSLFEDRNRVLWIASDGGGVWYLTDGSSTPVPYLSNGVPVVNSNAVYAIYEDAEERKWIGTLRGGINLIHPRKNSFTNVTYNGVGENNVINNFILSFCQDNNNNIWIGTDGAGLRYWDRNKNTYRQYIHNAADKNSITSNFITGVLRDSDNNLWVSTWFGGINRLKGNSQSFEHYKCFNPRTGQDEYNTWFMYEDRNKKLWASTTNNGTLYIYNKEKNNFDLFDETVRNIQCLAEDKRNDLWGGNYTSLIRIDRRNKKHQFYTIGNPVRCILEDKDRNFWVGTEGGGLLLFNRKTGEFKRYTTGDGLPDNTILRMLEDNAGNIWFSTYSGICKFNITTKSCRNFSQSDGLQSNQFSFNAGLALKTGEFLFGGIKGFNIFHPDSIYDRNEIPRIFLTGLSVDNVPISKDDSYVKARTFELPSEISVPYNKAILSLDFIALEYTGSDKIKYAYLLEGWDKNWNNVNNFRKANYSRLREGVYTFKVKVTNSDGFWSKETTLLRIKVLPPWFRTWWAYTLYILSIAAGVYLYMVYSKRQERMRYEVKLAHMEKQKEKELTEKKISFFTHIAHEFRTPLTLIINPIKELVEADGDAHTSQKMSMVYRNSRRLLSLVDQLLLFRKVESVDEVMRVERFELFTVVKEICFCFSHNASSRNIDFELKSSDKEVWVYADKEKIEIILFNLISNAFKYTDSGGKVSIAITENSRDLDISVKDTGRGISPEVGDKLFDSFYQVNNMNKETKTGFGVGLYVSQKLAMAHFGKIFYTSKENEGTEFHLRLLKGKDHFNPAFIVEGGNSGQTLVKELMEETEEETLLMNEKVPGHNQSDVIDKLQSKLPTMVVVDDNAEMRSYFRQIFDTSFNILEAEDGGDGYDEVMRETPDIVISDIRMKTVSGIELCERIKNTPQVAHIPVILLTGSSAEDIRLKGIECGAEDYFTKPFDKDIVVARVKNILQGRNRLQQYFFDAVTLKPNFNIGGEHKEFIEKCIEVVENHLDNPDFTIQTFSREIGMSHPSLYKKVKSVSGLTVNIFIRYLRLRKAAELLISTDKTIVEVAYITGFNDVRYFREQFNKLFKMNPSEYVRKYRKVLGGIKR